MKDGFCSVSKEMSDESSPNLEQQGMANAKFESHDLDLLFKVTKVFEMVPAQHI